MENFKSIFSGSSRDSEGHRESFLQDSNKNVINISPQKEAEPPSVQPGHTLIPIHMSAMNNITNDVKSLRPNTKGIRWGLVLQVCLADWKYHCAQVKYRLQFDLIMEQLRSVWDGFFAPLKFYVPLSVVSYFNEVQNACFDPFTRSCPQPPSYYHLPLIFAFTLLFLFLGAALMSWGRERDYSKGLAQGTIVGFMMFFIFMMSGFWGWDNL